jgi:type I site-specific restriction endonuclease
MQTNHLDDVSKVCITTIQRLYSMLKGEAEFDPGNEERSMFVAASPFKEPIPVSYNPALPIETFDYIVTDECHRSIYKLWRQALNYFDAFIIGLTATPSKQTLGYFNQNVVTEYGHEQAVADGVNVDFDIYRIRTEITEHGSTVDAGYYVDKRDRKTRKVRWQQLDEDLSYDAASRPRYSVARPNSHSHPHIQGEAVYGDISRPHVGPKDPYLRQRRQPCRGHCEHRPRGVWQRERFLPKNHISHERGQGNDQENPARWKGS